MPLVTVVRLIRTNVRAVRISGIEVFMISSLTRWNDLCYGGTPQKVEGSRQYDPRPAFFGFFVSIKRAGDRLCTTGRRQKGHLAFLGAPRMKKRLLLTYVIEWTPYSFHTPEALAERHKRRESEIERANSSILEPQVSIL